MTQAHSLATLSMSRAQHHTLSFRAHRGIPLLFMLALLLAFAQASHAQVANGTPPFASFSGGPDSVNLADLNSYTVFPVLQKSGRSMNVSVEIAYNTSIWAPVPSGSTKVWTNDAAWGWNLHAPIAGNVRYSETTSFGSGCATLIFSNLVYYDLFGSTHQFPGSAYVGINEGGQGCVFDQPLTATAGDGSGLKLFFDAENTQATTITERSGKVLSPGDVSDGSSDVLSGWIQDRNGNKITASNGVVTDTLGQTAITIAGSAPNPKTLTYTSPAGTQVSYRISFKSYTVKTNFGCSGISEYGPTSNSLVDRITLPDGSFYQFNYEATPGFAGDVTGRLASVTLPTGGTISYNYTGANDGVICTDGSTAGLQRTTPDGTWSYSRALGTGAASTTTITDPSSAANQTVIQFQGIYETQRKTYQGSSSGGTLLQTISTCYNGAASPCTGTTITLPITRRTQLVAYPDNTGKVCKHDQFFDTYGLPTEQDDYDYGTGGPGASPLRKVITVYNRNLTNGIVSMPSSVTICNGTGTSTACTGPSGSSTGTVVGQTTLAYDETAVVAPTGTSPQHFSVTGSRGNATTIKKLVSGSTFLTTTVSYYDTGNPKTVTDVNTAAMTYNYPDATSTCGNALPTSITEPISPLSKSMTWNCIGAVQLTATDETGATTTTAYSDPYFWRPASVTDPASVVANTSYNGPNSVETSLSINSNSTVDTLATLDGLGRNRLSQTRQSPGSPNFDTQEQDYDNLGRASRSTLPYTGSSGQTNATAPAVSTTYDALGRPLTITDAGNGTVTYSYNQNDILVSVGPAPTGESTKRRQFEYDGLGRLISVCEITSATGSGTCGQSVSQTGFWTKYTYDTNDNLISTTQNAQAAAGSQQARSFTFDFLSRLTSETNPENGTTTYTYDSASGCAGTYNGDLVRKLDAISNVTCFAYDPLHRKLSATYPSGTYASVTPSKYFVYDSATVSGVVMTNAKGRLAEAYTCTSCPGTKITDIGFSYTARGEVSDVYESTPHSSGYYHLTQSYWPHGALEQLSGLPGLPAITYGGTIGSTVGLDGEGRITQVTASSGQNPVTGVTYNNSSLPGQVNFGSGDSDIFAYDSNTMRMIQFKFNVGTQSQYLNGALTWNANGTLGQLALTDQFNSADTQTCNYGHDDLVRIATANCGAAASQAFSYDPFGNISKSGSPYQFQPTYNVATNRFATIPGVTPSYDANGNVLSDGSHNYAWDADGNSITIDTVGLTFDALDRTVEQNRSGAFTQIVYAPIGDKLALMSGQTLQKALIPLPGQATAVFSGVGLDHYRHPDWLGSARLSSSPSRTYMSSLAYAPFGETYSTYVQSGALDPSFTGMNPDTVSTDYDFLYRPYSTQGRWPTPDPVGLAAVDLSNPQSWNRYSYVLNNPLSQTDPLGLDCIYLWGDDSWTVAAGDCNDEINNGNGYYVPGQVSGVVTNDGQITGVTLDGGNDVWPVGFDYNSGSSSGSGGSGGDWILWGFDVNVLFGGGSSNAPSLSTVSKNLNRCAAPLSQTKSVSNLLLGGHAEVLGSNFFGDVSSLATGRGGLDQGAGIAVEGASQILEHAGAQVAVGTVTTISTPVSATAGVYNPVTVGIASQSFGGTIFGRFSLGLLKAAAIAKVGWDGAMYLAAEAACAAPAFTSP